VRIKCTLYIIAPSLKDGPDDDDDASLPAPTIPQTIIVDNKATYINVTNRYQ